MKRLPLVLAILSLGLSGVSCNWLTPLVFVGEHRQKVAPEFDKLPGKRVAVLVWVEPATEFDYPYARIELATYIGDKLQAEMNQRRLGTDLVDPRDVEEFVQKNKEAAIDPQAVGRRFDAEYVIYLEILAFQLRDPREPQLLRGRIEASVSVHDIRADSQQPRRYDLTSVTSFYPEGQPVLLSRTNAPLVREATYRKFAELVARKFYEYTVEL